MDQPPRDQYGRFSLLTLPLELLPSDIENWPAETRVLFDIHLERGEAHDASHSVIDASRVALYRLEPTGGLWGINAASYDLWRGGEAQATPLTADTVSLYAARMLHPDCPMRRCEDFDMRQEQVPVAVPGGATITMAGTPADIHDGDWIQVNGERYGSGELRQWARIASVDPARRTITISATTTESAAMYVRRELKRAPDPRTKPSRVPERLQRRRLDGRRAS